MRDCVIFDSEMLESSTSDLLRIVFDRVELSIDEFWMMPRTIEESDTELLLMLVFSALLLLSEDSETKLALIALLSTVDPETLL